MTRKQVIEARDFLHEILSEGERKYSEVQIAAELAGISINALYKAKQELRVRKRTQRYIAYLRLPTESRYGAEWQGDNKNAPSRKYIGDMPSEWLTVIYEETGGETE